MALFCSIDSPKNLVTSYGPFSRSSCNPHSVLQNSSLRFLPLPLIRPKRQIRQQIPPNSEHPPTSRRREPIHLPRILLHLPAIHQSLQPRRLIRQLKQPLPLILRQRRLFRQHARRILRFALLLPGCDLGLFARQLALVELVVVELGVVRFDAVEEGLGGL